MRIMILVLAVLVGYQFVLAQGTPKLDKATQEKLRAIAVDLTVAQKSEDESEVVRLAKMAIKVLGDQAGIPEVADQFREVPKNAKPLSPQELRTAFDPYIDFIEKQKWWADPHNARPAYHYIMVRGLAALAAVMPRDDADLPAVVESLRLALSARNPDFEQGIFNADSSLEALIRVKRLPPYVAEKLTDCNTNQAFKALECYAVEGFRVRKPLLGPRAWGQLLAYRNGDRR